MAARPAGITTVGRSVYRLMRALACMGMATGRLLLAPPHPGHAHTDEDDDLR